MTRYGVALFFMLFALPGALAQQTVEACSDPYESIMAGARAEWPLAEPYSLSGDWIVYFVRGYNDQEDREQDLQADDIVIFPIAEDYVFVFAFYEGCLTMYADLTPQKAYHLMELGQTLIRDETL